MKNAIKDFVSQISKTQSLISMHTAVSTDSDGKITAGALSNDRLVAEIVRVAQQDDGGNERSRQHLFPVERSWFRWQRLLDNQINLKDEAALDTALGEHGGRAKVFATETVTDYGDGATADYSEAEGMADVVQDYTALLLGDFYGTEGMVDHRDNYTKEIDRIEKRIVDLEKRAQAVKDQLTRSFVEMEKAQAKTNQEMQFFNQAIRLTIIHGFMIYNHTLNMGWRSALGQAGC